MEVRENSPRSRAPEERQRQAKACLSCLCRLDQLPRPTCLSRRLACCCLRQPIFAKVQLASNARSTRRHTGQWKDTTPFSLSLSINEQPHLRANLPNMDQILEQARSIYEGEIVSPLSLPPSLIVFRLSSLTRRTSGLPGPAARRTPPEPAALHLRRHRLPRRLHHAEHYPLALHRPRRHRADLLGRRASLAMVQSEG